MTNNDGRSIALYREACRLLHKWNFAPNVREDVEDAAARVKATYDELRSVVKYLRTNYVDVYLLQAITGKAEGDLFQFYLSKRKPRGRPSSKVSRPAIDVSSSQLLPSGAISTCTTPAAASFDHAEAGSGYPPPQWQFTHSAYAPPRDCYNNPLEARRADALQGVIPAPIDTRHLTPRWVESRGEWVPYNEVPAHMTADIYYQQQQHWPTENYHAQMMNMQQTPSEGSTDSEDDSYPCRRAPNRSKHAKRKIDEVAYTCVDHTNVWDSRSASAIHGGQYSGPAYPLADPMHVSRKARLVPPPPLNQPLQQPPYAPHAVITPGTVVGNGCYTGFGKATMLSPPRSNSFTGAYAESAYLHPPTQYVPGPPIAPAQLAMLQLPPHISTAMQHIGAPDTSNSVNIEGGLQRQQGVPLAAYPSTAPVATTAAGSATWAPPTATAASSTEESAMRVKLSALVSAAKLQASRESSPSQHPYPSSLQEQHEQEQQQQRELSASENSVAGTLARLCGPVVRA